MPRIETLQPGSVLPSRTFTATEVSLFLFNAAIWNPHRIHYDAAYATGVEGHPGIVIDGPLQGDWLSQVVTDWMDGDGDLLEFEYSNRRAAHLGQSLEVGGAIESVDVASGEVRLRLFVKDEAGEVVSPGSAVVRFDGGRASHG